MHFPKTKTDNLAASLYSTLEEMTSEQTSLFWAEIEQQLSSDAKFQSLSVEIKSSLKPPKNIAEWIVSLLYIIAFAPEVSFSLFSCMLDAAEKIANMQIISNIPTAESATVPSTPTENEPHCQDEACTSKDASSITTSSSADFSGCCTAPSIVRGNAVIDGVFQYTAHNRYFFLKVVSQILTLSHV